MIQVVDKLLTPDQHEFVLDYCENAAYHYGETDREDLPPTGMAHLIDPRRDIYELMRYATAPYSDGKELCEMYINCFAPSERPYFHVDADDGITMLYYPNEGWIPDDGGETQFYVDGEIRGIVPQPNRLVYFDASILHRATSFRSGHRFTVAIKFE